MISMVVCPAHEQPEPALTKRIRTCINADRRVIIMPQRIVLGDIVRLSFEIESAAPQAQHLLVGYAVHYIKANEGARENGFKLGTYTMRPGERIELKEKVSLAILTTLRHCPGHHRVCAIINGEARSLGNFEVIA